MDTCTLLTHTYTEWKLCKVAIISWRLGIYIRTTIMTQVFTIWPSRGQHQHMLTRGSQASYLIQHVPLLVMYEYNSSTVTIIVFLFLIHIWWFASLSLSLSLAGLVCVIIPCSNLSCRRMGGKRQQRSGSELASWGLDEATHTDR